MSRLALLIVAAGVLPAQSVVIPAANANVEGNSVDRDPFGLEGTRHLTYIHQNHLAQVPVSTAINAIAYRRDTPLPIQVMRRPPGIWQIRMGSYQGSVAQPPSAWPPANDPNWTRVFQPRQISFPDLPQPSGSGPAPFDLVFWLDQPFVYRGTHIGIEHFVADSQLRHDYFIDFVDGLVPGGTVDPLPGGQGCPAGQNRATGQAPNPGGGDAEFYLFGAPPQTGVFLGIGTSDRTWAGAPLPIDLRAAGLVGCSIMVSLDGLLPVPTTSAGVAEARWPIPGVPYLLGASLFAQWLCPNDPRVSQTLPVTLSDGLRYTFGSNLNSGFIGMSVVSAFSGSNQTGYVFPNRGPVVQLRW